MPLALIFLLFSAAAWLPGCEEETLAVCEEYSKHIVVDGTVTCPDCTGGTVELSLCEGLSTRCESTHTMRGGTPGECVAKQSIVAPLAEPTTFRLEGDIRWALWNGADETSGLRLDVLGYGDVNANGRICDPGEPGKGITLLDIENTTGVEIVLEKGICSIRT